MSLFHRSKGIDISSNNHVTGEPIDFRKVKAKGIDFVYVKATQGTDYLNPYLLGDSRNAFDAGMKVGLYHFAGTPNPIDEANWFFENGIKNVHIHNGADVLSIYSMLDYETMGPNKEWAEQFIKRVSELYKPVLGQYLDRSYFSSMGENGKFTWLAWPGWSVKEGMPKGVQIVQYGSEHIGGIPGVLTDVNYCADLRTILIGPTSPEDIDVPGKPDDTDKPGTDTVITLKPDGTYRIEHNAVR